MNLNSRTGQNRKKSRKKGRSIKGAAKDSSGASQWDLVSKEEASTATKTESVIVAKAREVKDPETLAMLPPLDRIASGAPLAQSSQLEKEVLMEQLVGTQRQSEEVLALARDSVAFVKASSQQSLILLKEQVLELKEREQILTEENAAAKGRILKLEEELLKEKKLREDLETLQKFK